MPKEVTGSADAPMCLALNQVLMVQPRGIQQNSEHFLHERRSKSSQTSPLIFLLLNLTQGRYRTVFGYHFVQIFDLGFCHLVSEPPLVPEFCI